MPTTWECPQCRRRVPLSVEECRCGSLRPRPGAPVNRPPGRGNGQFSWRDVPRSVIVSLAVAALAVVASIVWAILSPPRPLPLVPLLGYMDRPLPTPKPTPTPPPDASPAATPPEAEPTPVPSEPPAEILDPRYDQIPTVVDGPTPVPQPSSP